jgi:hypothetical protein
MPEASHSSALISWDATPQLHQILFTRGPAVMVMFA